jgi:hypothetical protein
MTAALTQIVTGMHFALHRCARLDAAGSFFRLIATNGAAFA